MPFVKLNADVKTSRTSFRIFVRQRNVFVAAGGSIETHWDVKG